MRLGLLRCSMLVWTSCITDFGDEPTYIRFGDIRLGQQSRYVRMHGAQYGNTATNVYEILPDTLVVTVIGFDSLGFVLEDRLTHVPQNYATDYDTITFTYHVRTRSDTLQVLGYSHLFWSYYSGGYKAKLCLLPLGGRRFTLNGWKLGEDPVTGKSSGYIFNAVVQQRRFDRANVYYDHFEYDIIAPPDSPPYYTGYGGPTFIYSQDYGMIRSRYVGKPTWDQGICWDLILP